MIKGLWVTAVTAGLIAQPSLASNNCLDDAMIVFDGSGSMSHAGTSALNSTKIQDAREALAIALLRALAS